MSNFRRVQVGEATLRVALKGGGPLVVLIHGFPETSHEWTRVIPLLGDRFTLYAIDTRRPMARAPS